MSLNAQAVGFKYFQLADELEQKVKAGIFNTGEKLPSLRKMHAQTGLSITTVYQAYIELEKRGLVQAAQKSGFFVQPQLKTLLAAPDFKTLQSVPTKVTVSSLAYTIVKDMGDPDILQLGGAAVTPDLLPIKQLARSIKATPASALQLLLARYENPYGNLELRKQIARRMSALSRPAAIDEILITSGCVEAVHLCLQAVANAGDTIVVESPTYPWFLQLIEDLKMYALEVQTDPHTGIDLQALENTLNHNKVTACLLVPNFHNPLGFEMPVDNKKRLVEILTRRKIPVIEDNIYGELYFGRRQPATLKALDKKGFVMYCSSFSKTLAPGLRVGWTMPGKFGEKVQRLKLDSTVASPTLNQQVVADFLKSGAFDRHLRHLRTALKNQVANTAMAIARHFPKDTKITAPQGGFTLWVQLPTGLSSLKLYHEARKRKISIFPGIICSTTRKYNNFIRISCGYPWSDRIERGIAALADIIASGAIGSSQR